MAQGGWLNRLGERWLERASAGRAQGTVGNWKVGNAGAAMVARAFVSTTRPVPAGDKLFLNSEVLSTLGAWCASTISSGRTATHECMTISPDGDVAIGAVTRTFVKQASGNIEAYPSPSKFRADGTCRKAGKMTNAAVQTILRGIVAEGSSGVFFCSHLTQTTSYNAELYVINATMATKIASNRDSGVIMDIVADTVSSGAVFASWVLNGSRNMAIVGKIGADGLWVFRKTLYQTTNAAGNDTIFSSAYVDSSGNVYAFGSAQGAFIGTFIAKHNSSGTLQWQRSFATGKYPTSNGMNGAFGWALSSGVYFVAAVSFPSSRYGTCLARFTSAGAVTWQKEFADGTGHAQFYAGATDRAGRTIVAFSVPNASSGIILASVDDNGAVEWQYKFDTLETLNPTDQMKTVTLAADQQWVYVNFCALGAILKLPIGGGFADSWYDADKQITITITASSIPFNTTTYTAATTSFTSAIVSTSNASTIAISTAQNTPRFSLAKIPSLTALPPWPEISYSLARRFDANVGSSDSGVVRAMSRDKGVAQAAITFDSILGVQGRHGIMLGTFCSPPLAGDQWVGEGGDAVLYIAESISNTALDFTAGSPEIYVWRPSTGKKVGTLHQAYEKRIGTPAASASVEKVIAVRFSPLPVYAQDQDVLVVEVWGQVDTPGMSAVYSGSTYYGGATENQADNAVVADFAAMLQFSGGIRLTIGSYALEQVEATSVQFDGVPEINASIVEQNLASDPYWNNVVMAMRMDQPNAIIDLKGHTFSAQPGRSVLPTLSDQNMVSGTASLEFDGSTKLMQCNQTIDFGTQDFTIEFWAYFSNTGLAFGMRGASDSGEKGGIGIDPDRYPVFYAGTHDFVGATKIELGTWNHFALVRVGNDFKLYANGALDLSFRYNVLDPYYWPNTSSVGLVRAVFGGAKARADIDGIWIEPEFPGFMDELRITLGVARYTSNFTPKIRFVTVDEPMTDAVAGWQFSQTPLCLATATATDSVSAIKSGETDGDITEAASPSESIDTSMYLFDVETGSAQDVVTGVFPTLTAVTEVADNTAEVWSYWPVHVSHIEAAVAKDVTTRQWVTPVQGSAVAQASSVATAFDRIDATAMGEAVALDELVAHAVFGMDHQAQAAAIAEASATIAHFVEGSAIAEAIAIPTGLAVFAVFSAETVAARDIVSPSNIKDVFVDEVVAALVIALADHYGPQPLSQDGVVALRRVAQVYVAAGGSARISLMSVTKGETIKTAGQTIVCKVDPNE